MTTDALQAALLNIPFGEAADKSYSAHTAYTQAVVNGCAGMPPVNPFPVHVGTEAGVELMEFTVTGTTTVAGCIRAIAELPVHDENRSQLEALFGPLDDTFSLAIGLMRVGHESWVASQRLAKMPESLDGPEVVVWREHITSVLLFGAFHTAYAGY